uniref:tRNA(Ile)-lysidine synthetase n=1 Tax=viral metagenome TaxID=1070528 RepID=A0A6C0LEE8_9ZZZZ
MIKDLLIKYYDIVEQYSKLEQLNCDFSTLEFNEDKYCISLSGGVDSMVLMDILYKRGKEIIAIHINYNNRDESKMEEDFLREYCESKNITFLCHSFNFKRGSIKRSEYESLTKQIKFKLYKSILLEYNLNYILLAHHKDDIIENIFTNFCRGENFLNLSVIKYSNIIMDVNIVRPLIDYYKNDIYDYAHFYEVPYFLDTTPDWSVRGKFRRAILPKLCDTFSGPTRLKNNLLSIAKESDEWGTLIQTRFINKYLQLIKYNETTAEMPIVTDNEDYSEFPMCFWNIVIGKVFHKFGKCAPSRKSLDIFITALKNKKNQNDFQILLKHRTKLIIQKNIISININQLR